MTALSKWRDGLSEMVGRVAVQVTGLWRAVATTTDATQTDYGFWDALARGKKATYKLAGLFVQPIIHHIVAWTLGKGVTAKCADEATEQALNGFLDAELKTLIDWVSEGMRLGDSYLVVNPDGSLTQAPPDQVTILPDDLDGRRVFGYKIESKEAKVDVTDEFRRDGRRITVKRKTQDALNTHVDFGAAFETPAVDDKGLPISNATQYRYANVIGRLPVIHYANNRGSNELYGRPEAEALLELLGEYDDTLTRALQGVRLMGNPKPAIEGVEDIEATLRALATATRREVIDGQEVEVPVVDFDSLDMVVTPKGSTFGFKGPAPFTEDAWRMLKNLFYLMLQHSHVPEWVWGGAIASSKASVDAQMPAWALFIALRRMTITPLIIALLQIWLAYRALVEPGLDANAEITLDWPSLTDENEEIKLKKIELGRKEGLLTDETTLGALGLVEDPAAELADVKVENEARQADFEASADKEIERLRLANANADDETGDDPDALDPAA